LLINKEGENENHITGDSDPMTRWLLQGKADEPWHILDIVDNNDIHLLTEPGMDEMGENWSVEVERGSLQDQKTSKR